MRKGQEGITQRELQAGALVLMRADGFEFSTGYEPDIFNRDNPRSKMWVKKARAVLVAAKAAKRTAA